MLIIIITSAIFILSIVDDINGECIMSSNCYLLKFQKFYNVHAQLFKSRRVENWLWTNTYAVTMVYHFV